MKGFIALLVSWAVFLLQLPDIVEKLRKWLPILSYVQEKVTGNVDALIAVLPRAPECGNCRAFYLFWPSVVSLALMFAGYFFFSVGYAKLTGSSLHDFLAAKLKVLPVVLFFIGQFLVLFLVQSWLLHRYSGLSLAESFSIWTFNGRVQAAHDKNFFLHASNIYGLIIILSYLAIVLLFQWAWVSYKKNPKMKAPHLPE